MTVPVIRDADGEFYPQSYADWPARKAAREARLAEIEAKRTPATVLPRPEHLKLVKCEELAEGDLIYIGAIDSGPYLILHLDSPNHPALKGSIRPVWVLCHDHEGFWDPAEPKILSFHFTQNHHIVQLWDEPKVREGYHLSAVNPAERPIARVIPLKSLSPLTDAFMSDRKKSGKAIAEFDDLNPMGPAK